MAVSYHAIAMSRIFTSYEDRIIKNGSRILFISDGPMRHKMVKTAPLSENLFLSVEKVNNNKTPLI